VNAIDAVGRELGQDGDTDAVLRALREHDVGFLYAIMGLMAITGVPFADAKWIVHASSAYADSRRDREDSWAAMYDEVMNDPEVDRRYFARAMSVLCRRPTRPVWARCDPRRGRPRPPTWANLADAGHDSRWPAFLCAKGRDLTTAAGWRSAIGSYNAPDAYAASVTDAANRYASA
jgi:hypothetical protein